MFARHNNLYDYLCLALYDKDKMRAHLVKAIHNFNAITDFHDLGYSDWSASASFYALYHGLLAFLAREGYESRNQSCTFALIEYFITKGEIKALSITDLKEVFDKDVTTSLEHSAKILDISNQKSVKKCLGYTQVKIQFLIMKV